MARLSDYSGAPKTPKPIVPSAAQLEAKRLQEEAATLLSQAKTGASTLATQLGAKVDPSTGKIITSTIDPIKAAQFNTTPFMTATQPNTLQTNTKTVVNTITDPVTGDVYAVWSDGSRTLLASGGSKKKSESAFELFRGYLSQFGLEGLASDVEKYKQDGLSDAELLLKLRTESTAYKNRFKANETRIAKGLRALSEAEYILQEDKYQDVMRRYGLPESYYTRGAMGRQEGFEKLIGNDVSSIELEDRIQTAQNRVINAAPEIGQALREFYPDITNGDILAYALDPDKAIENIKRKVTAAEIGGAAMGQGLATGLSRAEELARYGVTGAQAREGFQAVAGVLPRASMLADIYAKQEVGPYTQTTAEQEVFGLTGSAEAQKKRQKLTQLEQAQFAGSSGAAGGALSRERAGQF